MFVFVLEHFCVCSFFRRMQDCKMCVKFEMVVFHLKHLLELPLRSTALDLIVAAHVHQFKTNQQICFYVCV